MCILSKARLADFLAQSRKRRLAVAALALFVLRRAATRPLPPAERAALFALAEKGLLPGGLFAYGYRAYEKDDGALRFLVRELAPEMDAAQAGEFLLELKKLGAFYFARHPEAAAKLDQAIAAKMPDRFFADYDESNARSGSFDTIVALRPRGFVYAGDADIGANYIDLAAPVSANQIIIDSRDNQLYEAIKDFALNRQDRCDIWCRQPAPMSESLAELFGSFVYGITCPRDDVPKQMKTEGKPDRSRHAFLYQTHRPYDHDAAQHRRFSRRIRKAGVLRRPTWSAPSRFSSRAVWRARCVAISAAPVPISKCRV